MAPRSSAVHVAVYSGVEVYECFIKGVSVMRRRRDSWLNATQILKVADFDKPQRTRVLERQVQIGAHEKVQGGYGKYQGTWVPFQRGVDLATKYKVDGIMSPILSLDIDEGKAIAPKKKQTKQKKPSVRGRRGRKPSSLSSSTLHSVNEKQPNSSISPTIESSMNKVNLPGAEEQVSATPLPASPNALLSPNDNTIKPVEELGMLEAPLDKYEESLLDFFLHPEEGRIPSFLYSPPPDFQVNSVIDDDGHTSLHWACSMGHIEMIKLLLRANADIGVCNRLSQTPLMRSVIFTNNYDCQTFGQVLELLQSTIYAVDTNGQSIFHHIVQSTSTPSKVAAAKYYLDCILEKLISIQPFENVVRLVNLQDSNGDTSLLIAARNGAMDCVNSLLSYNANPSIPNRQRRTASEYLLEADKKPHSLLQSNSNASHSAFSFSGISPAIISPSCSSHAFVKAIPSISSKFSQLAEEYESQLREKEEDLIRRNRLKQDTLNEISRTYQELTFLQKNNPTYSQSMENLIREAQETYQQLSKRLLIWLEARQIFDLERSLKPHTSLSISFPSDFLKKEDGLSLNNDFKKPACNNVTNSDEYEQLINKLTSLQASRKKDTLYIRKLYEELGIDDTVNSYRRLIAMSCGINPEDLSLEILDAVEEALTREK
nr:DNA binding protein (CDC10 partner) [Schizosaccharomyces pombe]